MTLILANLQEVFLEAEPLKIDDILHNTEEQDSFQKNLIFNTAHHCQIRRRLLQYEKYLKDDQPYESIIVGNADGRC